jgi:hypothetical protein
MPTMPELLDRETEVGAITMRARDAIEGRGSVLLVEGPAGIGKTALMRAGRLIAAELGLSALIARGAELERDFGFGVVRQLFESLIDQNGALEEAFAGRARLAAGLLGVDLSGGSAPVPSGPDAGYVILNALYWLTVNVARRWSYSSMICIGRTRHRCASCPIWLTGSMGSR